MLIRPLNFSLFFLPVTDILPGHYPGAINIPYTTLLDPSGKVKDTESLAEIFKDAGVDMTRPFWASCGKSFWPPTCSGILGFAFMMVPGASGFKRHHQNLSSQRGRERRREGKVTSLEGAKLQVYLT